MFFITQIYGKGVRRGGHGIGSNGRYNVFANGEHEEHEIFSLVNRFVFANGEHEEHEIFFSQQITQITQKIKFVLFVFSVDKRKIIRVICVIR